MSSSSSGGENGDNQIGKRKCFYWKRKKDSEKIYELRLKQQQMAKDIWKKHIEKHSAAISTEDKTNLKTSVNNALDEKVDKVIEGRRIMNVDSLAKDMICKQCDTNLHLKDVEGEKKFGLASIFYIRCQKCKVICSVATDTKHCTSNNQSHFDTNTKAVIGVMSAGMGITHLNKILAALNMSPIHWKTFKSHETEVGNCAEQMAWESCKEATFEEKRLTIQNIDVVKNLLPSHLNLTHIFPGLPEDTDFENTDIEILMECIVRLFVLFDFGWTTKGSGKSYDSLCGNGAMIGFFTGKVMAHITLNRKCKSCDLGIPLDKHICYKNFEGSAKAMEPYAAAQLVSNNSIFIQCKVEVGGVGANNDSSAIKAMRDAVKHEIFKHSDKNHSTKGVVSELYRTKKNRRIKELGDQEIAYLKKCFSYCVSQCKGNSDDLATALANIPNHCYNMHDKCGDWCGYHKDPETYKHSSLGDGDGFSDENLYGELTCLFENLAEKSSEFSAGISTNVNESFNAILASFSPKSRLYSLSGSGSQRTSLGVNKKNEGQKYAVDLNSNLSLNPGKNTLKYANRVDTNAKKRFKSQSTIESKRRRLKNKNSRRELKYKNKTVEGTTYKSNMGLLDLQQPLTNIVLDESLPCIVVLFDLETGGFEMTADILQIAAKYNNNEFSVYVYPTQNISEHASLANNLTFVNGNLQYKGENVLACSLEEAMHKFHEFLCSLNRRCVLTAHNCKFDYPRLVRAMPLVSMKEHFKNLIGGFGDTLPILKKVTGRTGKGQNKLETMAKDYKINASEAYNALCDVQILHQLLVKLKISDNQILNSSLSWKDIEQKKISKTTSTNKVSRNEIKRAMQELEVLTNVSKSMRRKIVAAKITYNMILEAYNKSKYLGVKDLLGKDKNDKIKVTKCPKVLEKICDFLKKDASKKSSVVH